MSRVARTLQSRRNSKGGASVEGANRELKKREMTSLPSNIILPKQSSRSGPGKKQRQVTSGVLTRSAKGTNATTATGSKRNDTFPRSPRRWTSAEDKSLKEGVEKYGPRKWKVIARDFLNGERTEAQCFARWKEALKPGIVKGPWSEAEDAMIIRCKNEGMTSWSKISKHVRGRGGKQCRDRWLNHLAPSINHGEWTEEEDRRLILAQRKLGNKWTQIAKQLPGRTENSVKNRWGVHVRRMKRHTRTRVTNGESVVVSNGILPSMERRPENPRLSPVRLRSNAGAGNLQAMKQQLSSLGPDAPHRKWFSDAGENELSRDLPRKILPSLNSKDASAMGKSGLDADEAFGSSVLPFVVRSPLPSKTEEASKKKRMFHHQKNRPPRLKAGNDEHVFKVPTPRDPSTSMMTPHDDSLSFILTPRSTSSRPSSSRSTGSNRSFFPKDFSDAKVEKMANEFVNAEARRREVLRGIKLSDMEKAMMKRAFIAGLRNPASIVSPSNVHGQESLGDVQWEFDPSESLDAMGFSFDDASEGHRSVDHISVDPICARKDDTRNIVVEPIINRIEPIALNRSGAKWPEYEPEADDDVDNDMSISMLSMSLEDSAASHDLDLGAMGLITGTQIHHSFASRGSENGVAVVSPL